MKKMKQLLALAVMIPLFFVGCQKSDTFETDKTTPADFGDFKNNIEYCGEPEMYNMALHGGSYIGGTVKIGNDANGMLYITMEAKSGEAFIETRFWVGDIYSDPMPGIVTPTVDYPYPENGEAHFNLKPTAPWLDWTVYDPLNMPTAVTYSYDISNMDCFQIVVQAKVPNFGVPLIIWGTDLFKTNGYYIEYCKEECETEVSCETAFALGDDATCFLQINKDLGYPLPGTPSSNFNRWGWTNQVEFTEEAWAEDMEFEFWAAAGQCDTDKGTHIGTVTVAWDGTDATVTFSTFEGYTVENTHLYIGETYVPQAKNGNWTIAPGQLPFKTPYSANASNTEVVYMEGSFEPGTYFIIAHAGDLCGEYPE